MRNLVMLYLQKMGTILSDRRAINYAVAVLVVLLGIPYAVDTTGVDSEVVNAVVVVIQGLVVLVGHLGLTKSWETRPPSGLAYKEVLEAYVAPVSPETQAVEQLLRDAGVELP